MYLKKCFLFDIQVTSYPIVSLSALVCLTIPILYSLPSVIAGLTVPGSLAQPFPNNQIIVQSLFIRHYSLVSLFDFFFSILLCGYVHYNILCNLILFFLTDPISTFIISFFYTTSTITVSNIQTYQQYVHNVIYISLEFLLYQKTHYLQARRTYLFVLFEVTIVRNVQNHSQTQLQGGIRICGTISMLLF